MRLCHRQPDGATLREHLQAGAAATGRAHPDLMLPVPVGGEAVWEAFIGLSAGRPVGLTGAAQIPPSEYVAWQTLHGLQLSSWEVDTLQAMDRAALAQSAALQPKKAKP